MIDPIALKLGPLTIRWYALCILTGVVLAVYLAYKEAPRKKMRSEDILDFILIAFPLAIFGARFYYVAFSEQLQYYLDNPLKILAVWEGGLAIYGGLITGALVMLVFSRRRLINFVDFLDLAAPSVMIAQSIGRWGNFFNQEAYGQAVKNLNFLPSIIRRQMYIDGSYRVPTFLYESLWNLLGFIILVSIRHRGWLKRGEATASYLIWYGFGRFMIEGLRTDSLMLAGLRVSQWLSVLLFLLGLGIFVYTRTNKKQALY